MSRCTFGKWGTIVLALFAALVSTSQAMAVERVAGLTITSVVTKAGAIFRYNVYTVTANFKIIRAADPGDIYLSVTLREVDIIWDETFGPVTVKSGGWNLRADGQFETNPIAVNFPGISGYYGTDWSVKNQDVTQVACPKQGAKVGAGVDHPAGGPFAYEFVVANDPDRVGMDSSMEVVGLIVGDVEFEIVPPLAVGEQRVIPYEDERAPLPDEDAGTNGENESLLPYTVIFSDGDYVTGMCGGPGAPPTPVMDSSWGAVKNLFR